MQQLRNFFGKLTGRETTTSTPTGGDTTYKIKDLQKELDDAKVEIRELKQVIKEKDKEIAALKAGQ